MAAKRAKTAPVEPKTPKSTKKQPTAASSGVGARLSEKDTTETYVPDKTERTIQKYVNRRSEDMMDYRRGLGVEERWREADEEYIPHELDFGTTRKRFETDQDTGLRSRMVPVGDITQQWRSAASAPTLLVKIQSAVSIIVDQQPEAELVALQKKYTDTTDLAYALWKRNWQITNAKEKLKVLIFDLIKYGWAAQRTFPRKVEYDKRVLVEVDPTDPNNDKYEDKKLLWFNDIDRQHLNVYTTWIDELAEPYDPYSVNECYYEMDFSYDAATVEFEKYPNWKYVRRDSQVLRDEVTRKNNRQDPNQKLRRRKDVVTIGFFQSRHKDLYVVKAVKDDIVLYAGPLPNDDGFLDLTHTMWLLRKSNMPYGISLWEIIRQNKQLYDKMKNMTMDQLVLSIMKFGFFSGTNTAIGDGKIEIVPGQARQLTTSGGDASKAVNWMEIPGPGEDAWKGLEALSAMMDDDSGISPALEGEITGKTLGEILHAKDASLKRLKVPVDNIAWQIEQDAYLTLSWMSQAYAIPTLKEFASEEEVMAFEQEEQINHVGGLFATKAVDDNGDPVIDPDTQQQKLTGPFTAQYYPQLALHLEDSNGQLKKGKESKFFQVGTDIKPNQLKWRGLFKVIPRSIVDTSQDLMKAMHMEIFNMLIPLLQFPPELVARPCAQILKDNELDPEDWLPDAFIQYLHTGQTPQPAPPGAPGAPPPGAPGGTVMPTPGMNEGNTIQAQSGLTPPQSAKIVPGSQMPNISQLTGGKPGMFNKRMQ